MPISLMVSSSSILSVPTKPGNYGGLAACILMSERARKGLEEKEYIITGPEQHLPKRNADLLKFK